MEQGPQWRNGIPNQDALSWGEMRFHETDMPEDFAYQHHLSEYGTPRRVHVIDPFNPTSYRVTKTGNLEEHPDGMRGLVGFADIYRGSNEPNYYKVRRINSNTGEQEEELRKYYDSTNVGWVKSVHAGVGRGIMEYLHKTTHEKAQINLGKMMHPRMGSLAEQMNKQYPNRVRGKVRY